MNSFTFFCSVSYKPYNSYHGLKPNKYIAIFFKEYNINTASFIYFMAHRIWTMAPS